MKIKQLLLSVLTLGVSLIANAQAPHRCGSMEHLAEQIRQNPMAAKAYQKARTTAAAYAAANPIESRSLITIPVVVHVVYKAAAANISDAQIASQIAVLNEDYGGANADSTQIPAVFKPLFANTRVQFCLAKQTPAGAATTGILRKVTTTTTFGTNDAVKKTTTGGDDAWDATKYLNLWVCDLGNSLLGYAQFPGGPNATDGVVIHYKYFGRNGTAIAPYNKGRTATHEVGHWIGLYHIDGDNTCGNDGIADTPTQSTLNYGCPTFPHITCNNGPNGEMFMNYMDYVDDACMVMFSRGQGAMARSIINTSRASLITSPGCIVPTLAADDGALVSLVVAGNTCGDIITPSIVFKNAGNTTVTSAVIEYSIDGGTPVSYTYSGSLASMASASIALPASPPQTSGRHNITVTIINVNGNPDTSTNGTNVQTDAFTTRAGNDSESSAVAVNSTSGCSLDANAVFNFKNTGCSAITTASISYTIDGGAAQNYTYTGNLASGASANIALPTLTGLAIGAHTIIITVNTINSAPDANTTTANTATKIFTLTGNVGTVLASQGFQGAFPPTGYTINNPDVGSITWARGTKGKGSTRSAFMDFFSYGGATVSQNGQTDDLNLPLANIVGIAGNVATTMPVLTFDVAYAYYSIDGTDCNNAAGTPAQQSPCSYDTLVVRVSTNCGGSWTEVYRKQKDLLSTAPADTVAFAPTATQWRSEQVDLSAYANEQGLQIQFHTVNNFENNLYVDNINLSRVLATATTALNKQTTVFKLQPNPANDYTRIMLDTDIAEAITLNLYDAMGQLVRSQATKTINGHNEFVFDTAGLPAGCYHISVQSANIFGTQKLMVY